MSEHIIRWEFDRGGVTAEAICLAAPNADCHLTSVTCECEHWGQIDRRNDGTIWHHIEDYGDSHEPVWHEVKLMTDCNVCLFINESGCVEELGHGSFVIAETPIRPVWLDDGCDWERTPSPPAPEASAGVGEGGGVMADVVSMTRDERRAWLAAETPRHGLAAIIRKHIFHSSRPWPDGSRPAAPNWNSGCSCGEGMYFFEHDLHLADAILATTPPTATSDPAGTSEQEKADG